MAPARCFVDFLNARRRDCGLGRPLAVAMCRSHHGMHRHGGRRPHADRGPVSAARAGSRRAGMPPARRRHAAPWASLGAPNTSGTAAPRPASLCAAPPSARRRQGGVGTTRTAGRVTGTGIAWRTSGMRSASLATCGPRDGEGHMTSGRSAGPGTCRCQAGTTGASTARRGGLCRRGRPVRPCYANQHARGSARACEPNESLC